MSHLRNDQPPVLTIAGSDPSGGAGIQVSIDTSSNPHWLAENDWSQADLKTFAAHGCYGTSVLTALTVQNTTGVQNVFAVSPSFVKEQVLSFELWFLLAIHSTLGAD